MKNIKKLVEKMKKNNPEFCDEVLGLDSAALDSRLAQLAKDSEAVEVSKESDTQLTDAREQAKEFAAPYREAKAAIRDKIRYIVSMLESQ